MAKIEGLLSLLADFQSFTGNRPPQLSSDHLSELSEEELSLISAAKGRTSTMVPSDLPSPEFFKKKQ